MESRFTGFSESQNVDKISVDQTCISSVVMISSHSSVMVILEVVCSFPHTFGDIQDASGNVLNKDLG
jgi:hypothetical protein